MARSRTIACNQFNRHGKLSHPARDDLGDWHLVRFMRVEVARAEDVADVPAGRLGAWPAGQPLGNRVDQHDAPRGIGHDHAVTHARERRQQPLALVSLRLLGPSPFHDLPLQPVAFLSGVAD